MSFAKNKLKIAKDLLSKKDYAGSRDAANQVLEYEPENYHANVFLGLSLLELGENEKSEQAYRRAIALNSDQILAWQGLSKFYEQTETWEKYAETLQTLIQMHSNANDAIKCAETWQKLVELRRDRGTRLQIVDALSLVLPQSSVYPVLATLPLPDPTSPSSTTTFAAQTAVHQSLPLLEEMVTLVEKHEDETLRKEVEKRRTRLGAAGPEQLRREVGVEIWGKSRLPALYDDILNHPKTPDDLRRETDAKLLRYKQRYLNALPNTTEVAHIKAGLLKELDELVNGVVILLIPDELAWTIYMESKDIESVAAYDLLLIRQFIGLFPMSPMASLFRGYFNYIGISLFDEGDEGSLDDLDEDPFDMIINAYSSIPDSLIANRVLSDLYVRESDYENTIKVAESGLELLLRAETNTGRKLPSVRMGFQVVLVTSLVHLFPPKHHPRSLHLIEEVLSRSPDNVVCLMGHAYILQSANRWGEAATLFGRVDNLLPDDIHDGLRAREETAWCQCQVDETETGIASLQAVLEILNDLEGRDTDRARCLWRLGKAYWSLGGSKREEAYRYFIASLKANSSYAPAFTSLGIYYSESASPPDPTRASKCFQKAFELDPREAYAAQRLAEGFAEDREWDLVDVVARRTIEGEGGLDAGVADASASAAARYLPTNAWAWKAVGVVELNRRNYAPAIQAFQVALRAEPADALSWLRLGEAYSKAGRHVAGVKALERAHELAPDDWMCAYLIGDAQQQMGHFAAAIAAFESVLAARPGEVGVLVSLGQALLDQARAEHAEGFRARAEGSCVDAVHAGLRTVRESPGFRAVAWKTVADAVYTLCGRSSFYNEANVRGALVAVVALLPDELEHLAGILRVPPVAEAAPLGGVQALEIAVAAYSYRISLGGSEVAAGTGSAWYDLGIALYSWTTRQEGGGAHQAIACLTQALRADPGNDAYWTALGDVHFSTNVQRAQHAYIKALEIDAKGGDAGQNAATWTNLGLLYLHHDDVELANEALYRAQTLDPDYALAWVGQALVATANGHAADATALLEHAVGLTAPIPGADLAFATRLFLSAGPSAAPAALLPAFSALERYCAARPDDAGGLHLLGLVCERLGHGARGAALVARALGVLEARYEETEDAADERRYAVACASAARMRLGEGDAAGAEEAWGSVLGLVGEDAADAEGDADAAGGGDADAAGAEAWARERGTLRTQARLGTGLARFVAGDVAGALAFLGAAVEGAGDATLRGHATVLLAQAMWAVGTAEARETAKAQLLECIAGDPENVTAINTLAGMGVLTADAGLVDAALAEMLALPAERRHALDPARAVEYLLVQHHLGQGDTTGAVGVAQKAVFAEPWAAGARSALAALEIQRGGHAAALAVLEGGGGGGEGAEAEALGLRAVARVAGAVCSAADGGLALREAQRAVVLAPAVERHWRVLAYVRARTGIGNM